MEKSMKQKMVAFIGSVVLSCGYVQAASFVPLYNEGFRRPQTEEESFLVEHVEASLAKAEVLDSKLESSQLEIGGMSSNKVRHVLNGLCSLSECTYLEIGAYKGSTFVSALYGNLETLAEAIVCDNWSQFDAPRSQFLDNCEKHLSGYPFAIHECDCFALDLKSISHPIKVFFYDGENTLEAHEKAFTYFNEVLDDLFIAVVDDWNWDFVREGTFAAFKKLGYRVVFEKNLSARHNGDLENYWNGLYVAVISKS